LGACTVSGGRGALVRPRWGAGGGCCSLQLRLHALNLELRDALVELLNLHRRLAPLVLLSLLKLDSHLQRPKRWSASGDMQAPRRPRRCRGYAPPVESQFVFSSAVAMVVAVGCQRPATGRNWSSATRTRLHETLCDKRLAVHHPI